MNWKIQCCRINLLLIEFLFQIRRFNLLVTFKKGPVEGVFFFYQYAYKNV